MLNTSQTLGFGIRQLKARIDIIASGNVSDTIANDHVTNLVKKEQLPQLCHQLRNFQRSRRIAKSLHFPQIRERQSDIQEAHRSTFEWIFDKSTVTNFAEWLQSGSGIYWVTGKAGSGKSTLMKFLTRHDQTGSLLGIWSKGKPRLVAGHFFWSAGTQIQKSHEGLLRTILFDIIVGYPPLAQTICPTRWNEQPMDALEPWTRQELLECFRRLASTINLPVNLCIFVDGLDEYKGDHIQLIESLKLVSQSSHIKICASSRPWVEFADAFGGTPMHLHIHQLTKMDIQTFVRDNLSGSSRFQRLQLSDSESANNLVLEITTRASGVFLWVYLVVRSLLRGLTNEDDMSDLYSRLRELPFELEGFFERILESIEPVYKIRTARILKLVTLANSPLPLLSFFFLDLEDGRGSPQSSISFEHWPVVDQHGAELMRIKKRQLIAQCKDLLHISVSPEEPLLLSEKVGPLHRTVIDYLKVDHVDRELSRFAGNSFEPWQALFNANIGQLLSLLGRSRLVHLQPYLRDWFENVLDYELQIEAHMGRAETSALNDLERCLAEEFRKYPYSLQDGMREVLHWPKDCRCFLELAIQRGLNIYATEKIEACSEAELAVVADCSLGGHPCVGWHSNTISDPNMAVLKYILASGIAPSAGAMIQNHPAFSGPRRRGHGEDKGEEQAAEKQDDRHESAIPDASASQNQDQNKRYSVLAIFSRLFHG
jgi:hypothetical protein